MVTEKQNNNDSNEKETRLNAIRDILSIGKNTNEFDINQWANYIIKK